MKFSYTLIYVEDVEASMLFYELAFDLKPGFLHESKQYGEMITGQTKLGFVQHQTAESHGFKYNKLTSKELPPGIELGFISEDVNKAFTKAINAGATSVSLPQEKPWGQTVSYVRDLNGLLIEICSEI